MDSSGVRAHQYDQVVGVARVTHHVVIALFRRALSLLEHPIDVVQKHVRPQRADYRPLRQTALTSRLQDALAKPQHVIVLYPLGQLQQHEVMPHRVEEGFEVQVDDLMQLLVDAAPNTLERLVRLAVRTVAIRTRLEIGLEDGLEHKAYGSLHHPITDSWDP